jgi:sarcosine oxidase subunit alpha
MSQTGPFRIAVTASRSLGRSLREDEPVGFQFDGRPLTGLAGDTLASALLANGLRTVGRSFKFHRPRGVFSAGVEEPNALVQLGSGAAAVPSARAPLVELYEGLAAHSCAGWPSLGFDFGRVLDFAAPLWAAGFYNKTFIWPSWHAYEWLIRRMAGFGRAPTGPDPDRYETRNIHCDVLVVGGGEAGLRAASAEAASGSRVLLADQGRQLGGRAAWDGLLVDGMPGARWTDNMTARLERAESVQILRRTTAIGHYDHGVVTLVERRPTMEMRDGTPVDRTPRERYWIVRTKRVVLATGAIEQPLVFCNNDRPGIILAGAAHAYLRRHAVAAGRRVVVATNNDSAYAVARDLKTAGVDVLALADSRYEVPRVLAEGLQALSIPVFAGSMPVDTRGFGALSSVRIGRLSLDGTSVSSVKDFACDALAVSGGWIPALHLYSQAGGKLAYREESGALEAVSGHPTVTVVGAAAAAPDVLSERLQPVGSRISPVGNTRRQWVDLRHDVTVSDLELAIRENFASIEHAKRYTTVGMSVDQGKTSNIAALEIVARLWGLKPSDLGHTTFRPPFVPVTLGAIAGRAIGAQFSPSRRTPLHDWHAAHGAVLEDFGEWKRPALYLRDGESRAQAILREARAVRSSAGLFDASSLGKIEVQGPDALEFLDCFYINNLRTLKPGRARYGLMLRESGIIFDDGTVVMLAPDHLLVTTTSGNSGRVAAWLEEWHQCEWPQLRVAISPVTDQWATVSLAGPRAREIVTTLYSDIDFSNAAMPHLAMRTGRILGAPARVYRVSFSGELTYEINVPASAGQTLWDALLEAGKPHDLHPFGINALLLMRLEKGFLHVGTDTDGTTVPDDVGWGKAAAGKAADFIGKRSLLLPEHVRPDRLQFVGLRSDDEIVVGSHCRFVGSSEATDGWVTSAGRGVLNGKPIALALLRGGRQRLGAEVSVHDDGQVTKAKVVEPLFYDAAGERMNA